jgi:UDP-N-acetylglucosamine:LPS N-acetylglucosamine transferase
MGGYNTVCELLTLRKPCVIVPRVEPVAEQWLRADRMQRLGLLRTIHPASLTPAALMTTVSQALCAPAGGRKPASLVLDGLQRLQREVERMIQQRATLLAARKEMEAAGLGRAAPWLARGGSDPWRTSLLTLRRSLRLDSLYAAGAALSTATPRELA